MSWSFVSGVYGVFFHDLVFFCLYIVVFLESRGLLSYQRC